MPAPVSAFIPTANALTDHDVHPGMEVPVAVWEVLSTIPDARSRQGSRHDLAPVIVIALAERSWPARSRRGCCWEWSRRSRAEGLLAETRAEMRDL